MNLDLKEGYVPPGKVKWISYKSPGPSLPVEITISVGLAFATVTKNWDIYVHIYVLLTNRSMQPLHSVICTSNMEVIKPFFQEKWSPKGVEGSLVTVIIIKGKDLLQVQQYYNVHISKLWYRSFRNSSWLKVFLEKIYFEVNPSSSFVSNQVVENYYPCVNL